MSAENKKIVLLGLAAIVVLFMLVSTIMGTYNQPTYPAAQQMQNTFIDLDSDGDIDYLINGQVIINRAGEPMFPTPGPTEGK